MPRALLISLAAVTALALSGGGGAEGATFYGKVGPNRTITLKNSNGKIVTSIKKGIHKFVITDTSGIHNFILSRAGTTVRKTTLEFEGQVTWTVRIKRGKTYRYYCSSHEDQMSRTFKVP
jgi:hypothetical protein